MTTTPNKKKIVFDKTLPHAVHIYATYRVRVADLKADNLPDLLKMAEDSADLNSIGFDKQGHSMEYAEEITGYLVDPLIQNASTTPGSTPLVTDYENSLFLDRDGQPTTDESVADVQRRLEARVAELESYVKTIAGLKTQDKPALYSLIAQADALVQKLATQPAKKAD